ncbi:hypothetical protein ACLOJK_030165 [Asimina triloba]
MNPSKPSKSIVVAGWLVRNLPPLPVENYSFTLAKIEAVFPQLSDWKERKRRKKKWNRRPFLALPPHLCQASRPSHSSSVDEDSASGFLFLMVKAANSHEDIEAGRGRRRRRSASISSEDSLCFSDAEEESWHSPYGSRGDCDASDTEISGAPERDRGGRSSSALDCSSDAEDLEIGQLEIKVHSLKAEKDCRICHLSLEGGNPESGIPIELGCSCKGDLAAAHKQCAETWFKIRGNK